MKKKKHEIKKKKKKTPICIGSDQKLFLFLLFIRQDVTWILFEFRFKDQRSVWLNISYEMAKKYFLNFRIKRLRKVKRITSRFHFWPIQVISPARK